MMEEITLQEENAVILLPTDIVKLEMTVHVYHDGKIIKAGRVMDISELRRAFMLAEEYYEDPDAIYALTDEGRKYLESLND